MALLFAIILLAVVALQSACVVGVGWSNWSAWSECSVSCGRVPIAAVERRTRSCPTQAGVCFGPNEEIRSCSALNECPEIEPSCENKNCPNCTSCRLNSQKKPICVAAQLRQECCPRGVPLARCFADPCQVAKCNMTDAQCIPNFCGGCNAEFYNRDYTTRLCLADAPIRTTTSTAPPSTTTATPTMPTTTTTTPPPSTTRAMPTTTAIPITCADVKCDACHRCHVDSRMTPVCVATRQRNECCPVGKRVVNCFADPCEVTKCGIADAKCIPNYCGGCNAEFYDKDYQRRVCVRKS